MCGNEKELETTSLRAGENNSKPNKRGMKKAIRQEHIEYYCDCPYCGVLLSDDVNMADMTQSKVKCPECGKTFWLEF